MDFKDIIKDINNKIYYPVYFLSGEEPYYIDKISKLLEKTVLTEDEKEFNQMIVYGRDVAIDQILGLAKEYPVFGNYRLVIVREAQHIKDIEKSDYLKSYLRKPVKTTILVFDYKYKKVDKRTEFSKLLGKTGVLYQSKALYESQVPEQIGLMIQARGYKTNQTITRLLAENLGTNLSKIENEVDKLVINVQKGTEITPEIIEKNIGISKDYNIFELQKALRERDVLKANKIVNYFASNPKENPAIKVIVILFGYFRKVFLYHFLVDKSPRNVASKLGIGPYFVNEFKQAASKYTTQKLRQIFAILRESDQKAKGVDSAPIEDGELMKEMIFKILH